MPGGEKPIIVKCPNCTTQYGIVPAQRAGEDITCSECLTSFIIASSNRSDAKYFQIVCPHCEAKLRPVKPRLLGRMARCKQCMRVFRMGVGESAEPMESEQPPMDATTVEDSLRSKVSQDSMNKTMPRRKGKQAKPSPQGPRNIPRPEDTILKKTSKRPERAAKPARKAKGGAGSVLRKIREEDLDKTVLEMPDDMEKRLGEMAAKEAAKKDAKKPATKPATQRAKESPREQAKAQAKKAGPPQVPTGPGARETGAKTIGGKPVAKPQAKDDAKGKARVEKKDLQADTVPTPAKDEDFTAFQGNAENVILAQSPVTVPPHPPVQKKPTKKVGEDHEPDKPEAKEPAGLAQETEAAPVQEKGEVGAAIGQGEESPAKAEGHKASEEPQDHRDESGPDEAGANGKTATGQRPEDASPGKVAMPKGRQWRQWDILEDTYQVLAPVGQGRLCVCHKVLHLGWGRVLVVKTPKKSALVEGGMDILAHATESWSLLGPHPHIVACHYIREIDGLRRIFLDCMPGGSLAAHMGEGRLPDPARRMELMRQAALGLAHAHGEGLAHQGLTPANIFIDGRGAARVSDFGLSRAWNKNGGQALSPFASPEAQNGKEIGPAGDVWSLGLVILALFSKEQAWEDGSKGPDILAERMGPGEEDPLPKDLDQLLSKCFEADPANRPDCDEIAQHLSDLALKNWGLDVGGDPLELDEPSGLNNLALARLDLGEEEESIGYWAEALSQNPGHGDAAYNQVLWSWQQGRMDDDTAEETLLTAAEEDQSGRTSRLLGRFLLSLDRTVQAQEAFEQGDAKDMDTGEFLEDRLLATSLKLGSRTAGEEAAGVVAEHVASLEDSPRKGVLSCLLDSVQAGLQKAESGYGKLRSTYPHLPETLQQGMAANLPGRYLVHRFKGHTSDITCAVALEKSGRLLTGGEDKTLKLWSLDNGKILRVMDGGAGPLRSAAISPDGSRAVTGWEVPWGVAEANGLTIWDLDEGAPLFEPAIKATVNALAMHEEGKLIMSASGRILRLWDMESGQRLHSLEGHEDPVNQVVMIPGSGKAASASGLYNSFESKPGTDNTVRIWDLETGRQEKVFEGHEREVTALAAHPDGAHLLSADASGQLLVWDLATGKRADRMRWPDEHGGPITLAAFMGQGKELVAARSSGRIRCMDMNTGIWRSVVNLAGRAEFAPMGVMEQCSSLVCCLGRKVVQVRLDFSMDLKRRISDPGGDGVVVCTLNQEERDGLAGEAAKWMRPKDKCGEPALAAEAAPVPAEDDVVKAKPEPKDEAAQLEQTAAKAREFFKSAQAAKPLKTGEDKEAVDQVPCLWIPAHASGVEDVSMSGDGQVLASAGGGQRLNIWDGQSGELTRELSTDGGAVSSVALSLDGRLALAGGFDLCLRLWDLEHGSLLWTSEEQPDVVERVAISGDGTFGVSASPGILSESDRQLVKWDIASGTMAHSFGGYQDHPTAIALSPDGRLLAAGDMEGGLKIFDIASGKLKLQLEGHREPLSVVTFSCDKLLLFSGDEQGKGALWDVATGIQRWAEDSHPGQLVGARFSRDDKDVFTAGRDGVVRAWSVEDGSRSERFIMSDQRITCLSCSGNHEIIVIGDAKGMVRATNLEDVEPWTPEPELPDDLASTYVNMAVSIDEFDDGQAETDGSGDRVEPLDPIPGDPKDISIPSIVFLSRPGRSRTQWLRARSETLDREVDVLLLWPDKKKAGHRDLADAFVSDMSAQKGFKHPNILAVLDCGMEGDILWAAYEPTSMSLAEYLDEAGGPIQMHKCFHFFRQMLGGLSYLQDPDREGPEEAAGEALVHHNLCPHTIRLQGSGPSARVKIGGLILDRGPTGDHLDRLRGLVRPSPYLPWRLLRCELDNDDGNGCDGSDVWSLAAILYTMLTGVPPRDLPPGGGAPKLIKPTLPIKQRIPGLEEHLARLIDLALVDDPMIPLPTAREVRALLDRAFGY